LWFNSAHWQWRTPEIKRLPVTIEVLIGQQLERLCLDPSVAMTIYSKALLPRTCPESVWRAVSNLSNPEFDHARLELIQIGWLHNNDFSHPLFAELAQQQMPSPMRRMLARRCLEHPATHHALPVLLAHAELPPSQELVQWQQAIESAIANNNPPQAARFVLAAFYLYPPELGQEAARTMAHVVTPHNLELAKALFSHLKVLTSPDAFVYAQVLAQTGALSQALSVLYQVQQPTPAWHEQRLLIHCLGEDHHTAFEFWHNTESLHHSQNHPMLIALAQSLMNLSHFEAAKSVLKQALLVAKTRSQRADTLLTRARLALYTGSRAAEADLQQALDDHQADGNSAGVAAVYHRLGLIAYYKGQPHNALMAFEQSQNLYAQLGHQQYWIVKAIYHATQTELGDYSKAEEGLLESDSAMTRLGLNSPRVEVCNNLSYLYRHWDMAYGATLAQKFAQQGLALARSLDNRRLECNCLYHLSKSQTLAGLAHAGLKSAQACMDLAQQLEYQTMQTYSLHARYGARRALGNLQAALQDLREVEAIMRQHEQFADADFYRVQLEMELGNVAQAKLFLGQLVSRSVVFWQAAKRQYPDLSETAEKPTPKNRLEVLGGITVNGKPLGGRKRKELLFLLAEARLAGRSEVTKLELLDALYAGEDDSLASGALRKTIHQLRNLLGQNSIVTSANGYALGAVETDAEVFLANHDTHLWRGGYGVGMLVKLDESVRDLLHQALFVQAKHTNTGETIRLCKILLESDPYHIEALRLWMQVLVENKNYKTLNRLYTDTKKRLNEIGESSPEHWSEFLDNGKSQQI
jgi:hypothetical protein